MVYKIPDSPFSNSKEVIDGMEKASFEIKSDRTNPMSGSITVLCDAIATLAHEIEELKSQKH